MHAPRVTESKVTSGLATVCLAVIAIMTITTGPASSRADEIAIPPEPPGPVPIEFISGCGTLLAGDVANNCWFFETHNGRVYAIDNIGSFGDGDAVCVNGQRVNATDCVLACPSGRGCIVNNSIVAGFVGPGTLDLDLDACARLNTEDGESYLLENSGPLGHEARAFVSGPLNPQADFCAPAPAPGIPNNSIDPLIEQCFTLQEGPQGCLVVVYNGEPFVVSNGDGPAIAGQSVHITGFIRRNWDSCPPLTTDAMIVWELAPCNPLPVIPGDVDNNGLVNFADLLMVISSWGPCVCPADVNGNGVVDFQDILVIFANWS